MSSPPPRDPVSPPKQTSQMDDQNHTASLDELSWEEFEARIAKNYNESQRAKAEEDAVLAAIDASQQPPAQQPQQRKRAGSASGPDNQKIPRRGSSVAVPSGESEGATEAGDDSDLGSACEGSIPSSTDHGTPWEPLYRNMPPPGRWPPLSPMRDPPSLTHTGSTKSDGGISDYLSEDSAQDPLTRTREAGARLQTVLREAAERGREQERVSEAADSSRDPYDSVTTISQDSTPPPAQPQADPGD